VLHSPFTQPVPSLQNDPSGHWVSSVHGGTQMLSRHTRYGGQSGRSSPHFGTQKLFWQTRSSGHSESSVHSGTHAPVRHTVPGGHASGGCGHSGSQMPLRHNPLKQSESVVHVCGTTVMSVEVAFDGISSPRKSPRFERSPPTVDVPFKGAVGLTVNVQATSGPLPIAGLLGVKFGLHTSKSATNTRKRSKLGGVSGRRGRKVNETSVVLSSGLTTHSLKLRKVVCDPLGATTEPDVDLDILAT
jgi:hypothetical protein